MRDIVGLISVIAWMAGIVLAKGAASTYIAAFFPPYSWYLVVEKTMLHFGML